MIETEGIVDFSLTIGNLIDAYLPGLLGVFTIWYRAARTNLFMSWMIFVYSFVSKNQ